MGTTAADTIGLLNRLIGFDSISKNSNKDMIAFIRDYLSSFGIQAKIFLDESGHKANLFATMGPNRPGGLMLAGHTDVVPVEGQDWATDPFVANLRDNRIYGRGSCDMKGFIATALALVPELTEQDRRVPVHLAFTYDEEIGCFGANALSAILAKSPHRPAFCIVGEPTSMAVVNGHKGKLSLDCTVRGTECHSAHNDRGVNAVEIAAEVITYLRSLQAEIKRGGHSDSRFDPPYTTIHTGTVQGGIARNIVPRDCRFEAEIRNLPSDDPLKFLNKVEKFIDDILLPEMHEIAPESTIRLDMQSLIPALSPDDTHEFLHYVLDSVKANQQKTVSFATEAGLYQGSGIQVIVCGPGNIAQAHRPDEYVELEQLNHCQQFLKNIINDMKSWP